jgi:hypothetical protein
LSKPGAVVGAGGPERVKRLQTLGLREVKALADHGPGGGADFIMAEPRPRRREQREPDRIADRDVGRLSTAIER